VAEDGSGRGGGWDCGNFRVNLRGQEFLAWDVFVSNEVFEWWVLKGKLGGPRAFLELSVADGLGC